MLRSENDSSESTRKRQSAELKLSSVRALEWPEIFYPCNVSLRRRLSPLPQHPRAPRPLAPSFAETLVSPLPIDSFVSLLSFDIVAGLAVKEFLLSLAYISPPCKTSAFLSHRPPLSHAVFVCSHRPSFPACEEREARAPANSMFR